jgi:hypothetical protein
MGRGAKACMGDSPENSPAIGSVAKFDFWAKSKNWVSGIQ